MAFHSLGRFAADRIRPGSAAEHSGQSGRPGGPSFRSPGVASAGLRERRFCTGAFAGRGSAGRGHGHLARPRPDDRSGTGRAPPGETLGSGCDALCGTQHGFPSRRRVHSGSCQSDARDAHQLVFVTSTDADGAMTHPRNLIVVEDGARLSLVESYVGLGESAASFTNAVTEVTLGKQSWLEHTRIQRESESAYHIGFSHVHQARESHYRSFTLSMGGRVSRHNLHTRLDAPNTEALLYGLSIGRGEQLVDNHTTIYHDQPNCRSWEVYKAILDGHSRGVFNGKVFVTPEAQQTDAKQTNRTLLLSDTARVDTKPQLEIFADDVKCTHGATVGYLDDLPLFYLRSRGVDPERAKRILTYAFAAEVMNEVAVEPVRRELDQVVRTRLGIADGV
ncbi:MAG: Fe-S cluster assembly protein SufD [Gemmatimonadales bacterium]|nr:MAG: Fe-S cluster assembly protein SufD [Gemmatimonadales bacterium]